MGKIIPIITIVIVIALGLLFVLTREETASIQVISPRKGDVFSTGSTQTILWSTKNIPDSNKISITIRRVPPPALPEEGQEFDPIIFTDLPNTGSKEWVISNMYPDGTYILGITSYVSVPVTNPVSVESEVFRIGKFETVGVLECYSSPKYYAIQKSLTPNVGSDILIKYKTNPSQNFPCEYKVADGDFEIKNVLAEYFLSFTDNFLLLDKGTAPPPRELIVYDLRSRKIVFTDFYARPVIVEGDSITYLSKTSKKPTMQNCASLNEYTKNGLGAVIMSKITIDLQSLEKNELGEFECLATQ